MLRWLFGRKKHSHHQHPSCDKCRNSGTVVRCVSHAVALCVSCMFVHDDPGVCNYIPDSDKRKHWSDREAPKKRNS